MNNPERLPSETHKPITGYLWGGLAVLTCPCHLPILEVRSHLARRNIDGQPERSPCQHSPVTHLAAGFAQHPSADFRHQAGRFDHGQELARWQ